MLTLGEWWDLTAAFLQAATFERKGSASELAIAVEAVEYRRGRRPAEGTHRLVRVPDRWAAPDSDKIARALVAARAVMFCPGTEEEETEPCGACGVVEAGHECGEAYPTEADRRWGPDSPPGCCEAPRPDPEPSMSGVERLFDPEGVQG